MMELLIAIIVVLGGIGIWYWLNWRAWKKEEQQIARDVENAKEYWAQEQRRSHIQRAFGTIAGRPVSSPTRKRPEDVVPMTVVENNTSYQVLFPTQLSNVESVIERGGTFGGAGAQDSFEPPSNPPPEADSPSPSVGSSDGGSSSSSSDS